MRSKRNNPDTPPCTETRVRLPLHWPTAKLCAYLSESTTFFRESTKVKWTSRRKKTTAKCEISAGGNNARGCASEREGGMETYFHTKGRKRNILTACPQISATKITEREIESIHRRVGE
ncbi:hypothetical protein AVEN_85419-1 [Araneus ventricosus]|uniref:Uncharacterized protein n=1 Tax=Araneus ventricosus TaxID=182803 RepID=A0A4Y2FIV8_ARAVE|nr:hypothetical protein AVEN_85419-1 [Araneus ventricosus]